MRWSSLQSITRSKTAIYCGRPDLPAPAKAFLAKVLTKPLKNLLL